MPVITQPLSVDKGINAERQPHVRHEPQHHRRSNVCAPTPSNSEPARGRCCRPTLQIDRRMILLLRLESKECSFESLIFATATHYHCPSTHGTAAARPRSGGAAIRRELQLNGEANRFGSSSTCFFANCVRDARETTRRRTSKQGRINDVDDASGRGIEQPHRSGSCSRALQLCGSASAHVRKGRAAPCAMATSVMRCGECRDGNAHEPPPRLRSQTTPLRNPVLRFSLPHLCLLRILVGWVDAAPEPLAPSHATCGGMTENCGALAVWPASV
jgi:hypothetical protein